MRSFMDGDYLLGGPSAHKLFYDYAQGMPIFDYHCHLPVKEILEDRHYSSITDLWLGGDHYKWRAMRAAGIDEKYITGDGDPREKFRMWARVTEKLIGNALYHWCHLELSRYFGIDEPLCEESADRIYDKCGEMLAKEEFGARELLRRMNVKALCTTDDPADDLAMHAQLREMDIGFKVLPTFRPDKAMWPDKPGYAEYIGKLGEANGISIRSIDDLTKALGTAMDRFQAAGCILSDHGMSVLAYTREQSRAEEIFGRALAGEQVSEEEAGIFASRIFDYITAEYVKRGWAMQLHLGVIRNNNPKLWEMIGPDCGADSIGPVSDPVKLSLFFSTLEKENRLPRTVLYCLNPADNPVLAGMAGNFGGGGIPGRVQFGAAWWFNDTLEGIRRQLDECINAGLIGYFTGMLTDSRSFSAFTRHEYFRRILCSRLGEAIDRGEYPAEKIDTIGRMVQDICFNNAARFFGLPE